MRVLPTPGTRLNANQSKTSSAIGLWARIALRSSPPTGGASRKCNFNYIVPLPACRQGPRLSRSWRDGALAGQLRLDRMIKKRLRRWKAVPEAHGRKTNNQIPNKFQSPNVQIAKTNIQSSYVQNFFIVILVMIPEPVRNRFGDGCFGTCQLSRSPNPFI
jgi:hypothetical protein